MPIWGSGTIITMQMVTGNVQAKLVNLHNALADVTSLYQWLSAYAVTDLETLGFAAADAQDVFNAVADASAVATMYNTGQPPSTYPQASSAYTYATSQRVVMGPSA
jgi:hypothetical protein